MLRGSDAHRKKKLFTKMAIPPRVRILLVLFGGFTVHFSLGTLFAYGNLAPYIASYIRNASHPHSITTGTTSLLYSVAVIGQGFSMALGGWLDRRIGPRLTTIAGSLIMSGGVMLSYFAIKVSFWFLLLTYGAMFGLGLGLAYIGPLACAIRWLPRWKGFSNGFILSGFGLGAVFTYLQTIYINPHNYPPEEEEGYFTHPDVLSRVPSSFLVFGGMHLVMLLGGALLLVNPPAKGRSLSRPQMSNSIEPTSSIDSTLQGSPSPPSFGIQSVEDDAASARLSVSKEYDTSGEAGGGGGHGRGSNLLEPGGQKMYGTSSWTPNVITSLMPRQMVGTLGFCYLWLLLACGGTAVTAVVTMYKYFGQSFIKDDHFLAITGSTSAVFNSAGSLIMGALADKFNYKAGLVCMAAIMSALLLTMYTSVVVGKGMFFVWVCGLFFCVGGLFALFPTATARSFGSKYFATNYGILFTANSFSAALSAVITSFIHPRLPWYGYLFLNSGFCVVAFVAALLYRHRRYLPFLHRQERE